MASVDPFFKIRPTRRSNPEARTTLDSLHQTHIQKMFEKEEMASKLLEQIQEIDEALPGLVDEIQYELMEKKKRELEREIEKIQNKNEIMDYFLETGEILYNYYDIQDKIQKGVEPSTKRAVGKPGSVLAALSNAAATQGEDAATPSTPGLESPTPFPVPGPVPSGEALRRDKLLEQYLLKVHPEHARGTNELEYDPFGQCPCCDMEMIFSANEANFTCTNCGHQEFVLVDSDKPSYKDPPREVSYYAYKRINHFNEWLAQFQAKESTEIPQEVYNAIIQELKKERINDYRTLSRAKMREILKKLKYNKYYEHVPHIINRLNGQHAPVMSREIEEKLRYMFKEIQPAFQKHCPKERSNFLSYSYVLYKFCELLELDEYLPSFPLLKNRDKLYVQDKIWEKICQDLSWQFIRSV